MARRRANLIPEAATNEGSRRLRVILRRSSFGAIARALLCDESAIRSYANERRKPVYALRARAREKLGIPEGSWDEPPKADTYETGDPPTKPRRQRRRR